MTRRFAIAALAMGISLLAVAYAAQLLLGATQRWTVWAYLLGMSTTMLAMLVLGVARREGGVGRLALPFAFIYLLLLTGFGLALGMPAESAADALWLGLPRRAAIVVYGIGLLPLFILPVAYALTFDSLTLREEDLARIAAAKREREREARLSATEPA